ncbi:MAG: hypothetical protein J0I81_10735, partial [Hyphomicrobium sp.]|nr:hypothetical protein [Hyphomicrobium sp.]
LRHGIFEEAFDVFCASTVREKRFFKTLGQRRPVGPGRIISQETLKFRRLTEARAQPDPIRELLSYGIVNFFFRLLEPVNIIGANGGDGFAECIDVTRIRSNRQKRRESRVELAKLIFLGSKEAWGRHGLKCRFGKSGCARKREPKDGASCRELR